MGLVHDPSPVMLLLAAFSRYEAALEWAGRKATEAWGPVARRSPPFEFSETDYYEATMGPELRKVFFGFARPVDPGCLPEIKLETNRWEEEYAARGETGEPRPLNLDPGYLDLGKLVLASTKDHAHRVYLGRGIYAEVTLRYKLRRWRHHEWTFADYRREDYQEFFSACRDDLRRRRREGGKTCTG